MKHTLHVLSQQLLKSAESQFIFFGKIQLPSSNENHHVKNISSFSSHDALKDRTLNSDQYSQRKAMSDDWKEFTIPIAAKNHLLDLHAQY